MVGCLLNNGKEIVKTICHNIEGDTLMRRMALAITTLLCLLSGSLGLLVVPGIFAAANEGMGLRGDYFSDASLSTLALSRIDPTANFNWKIGAPAAGLPKNHFSVRWTGQVIPRYSEA